MVHFGKQQEILRDLSTSEYPTLTVMKLRLGWGTQFRAALHLAPEGYALKSRMQAAFSSVAGLVGAYRVIEELVGIEVALEERGPGRDVSRDQCL